MEMNSMNKSSEQGGDMMGMMQEMMVKMDEMMSMMSQMMGSKESSGPINSDVMTQAVGKMKKMGGM